MDEDLGEGGRHSGRYRRAARRAAGKKGIKGHRRIVSGGVVASLLHTPATGVEAFGLEIERERVRDSRHVLCESSRTRSTPTKQTPRLESQDPSATNHSQRSTPHEECLRRIPAKNAQESLPREDAPRGTPHKPCPPILARQSEPNELSTAASAPRAALAPTSKPSTSGPGRAQPTAVFRLCKGRRCRFGEERRGEGRAREIPSSSLAGRSVPAWGSRFKALGRVERLAGAFSVGHCAAGCS